MSVNRVFYYQGDRRPYFKLNLSRGGALIDLSTVVGVRFDMYRTIGDNDAPVVTGAMAILDAVNGLVQYVWGPNDLDQPAGDYWACVTIDWGGEPETLPDEGYISVVIHPKGP